MTQDFKVSELQLFFGDPINADGITVYQPTIGDILEYDRKFGESEFFRILNAFIGNTTMYRLMLWDMGVDWNKISDFQLFMTLTQGLEIEKTRILFGDLDFREFELYTKELPPITTINEDGEKILTEVEPEIIMYQPPLLDIDTNEEIRPEVEINESTYKKIVLYLRTMFNIFPKEERVKGKTLKEWLIEEERIKYNQHKDDTSTSALLPLISSCLNHAGFKYKKNELREVGIYEFMNSVQRLQIYEQSTALLKGAYSGFMDSSKIPAEQFNFMRDITHDSK
jgi:hypothetical protein